MRTPDEERRKQLCREIARSRRQIDRSLGCSAAEMRRLVSWRTYVRRYPAASIATAAGVAFAATTAIRGGRLGRGFARMATALAIRMVGRKVWRSLVDSALAGDRVRGHDAS